MFPCRYGRRNSIHLYTAPTLGGAWWAGPLGRGVWVVHGGREHWQEPIVVGVLCVVVGVPTTIGLFVVVWQALGLLVPVGWALLLYTSGLSTQ